MSIVTQVDLSGDQKLEVVEHYYFPFGDNRVQIKTASASIAFSGKLIQDVLPKLLTLLDGTKTADEIISEMGKEIKPEQIKKVISGLYTNNLIRVVDEKSGLTDADRKKYSSMSNYLSFSGGRWDGVTAIKEGSVLIVGGGPVAISLATNLGNLGLGKISFVGQDGVEEITSDDIALCRYLSDDDEGKLPVDVVAKDFERLNFETEISNLGMQPNDVLGWREIVNGVDLVVAIVDGPILFHDWLDDLNKACLEEEVKWTSAALLDSRVFHVGPSVIPKVTACYTCYEKRWKSSLPSIEAYQPFESFIRTQKKFVDFGTFAPIVEMLSSSLVLEIVDLLSPDRIAKTAGKLLSTEVMSHDTVIHPVLKTPRCSTCSPIKGHPKPRAWN